MSDQGAGEQSPAELARRRCLGVTKRGACHMPPLTASDFCFNHDPARAPERAEARKRGGRGRKRVSRLDVPDVLELRRVEEIQELVERAAMDALQLDNGVQRSRVLGYLSGLALQALSVGSIEERLTALEAAARQQRAS
jgi:hypothetical protein